MGAAGMTPGFNPLCSSGVISSLSRFARMNLPDWMRRPTLYLARHGATDANERGEYRGWLDEPLNEDGLRAAEEMANFFAYETLGPVVCHDLARGIQTAEMICQEFDRNPMLRPWKHPFAGMSQAKCARQLQTFIDDPDKKVEDGESLNDFRRRWETTLSEYLAQAVHSENPLVLVTSNSCIVATAELYGQAATGKREIIQPGGIVALYFNADGSVDMVPKLGAIVYEDSAAS
jgi:broad specificity phosphatase PhoE